MRVPKEHSPKNQRSKMRTEAQSLLPLTNLLFRKWTASGYMGRLGGI